MRNVSRRSFLTYSAATAAALSAGSLPVFGQDVRTIRTSWWGGNARHEKMNAVFDAFEAANPDVRIVREYASYQSYWEKVPTQFAGNNAPDLMWFTERQISDYAEAGRLMDLRELEQYGLDLSGYRPSDLDMRSHEGKLVRLPMGDTICSVMANTKLFEEAGIPVPEGQWTWQEFHDTAVAINKAFDGKVYGTTYNCVDPQAFETSLVQDGKSLFSPDGAAAINFDVADATRWFRLWKDLLDAGGCVPADITSETQTAPFEDLPFASGLAAMGLNNSNQLSIYTVSLKARQGEDATASLAAFPQVGANPAMLIVGTDFAVKADTPFPEDIAHILNFYFNDPEPAKIMGMELGVPTNLHTLDLIRSGLNPTETYLADFHASIADIARPAVPYIEGGAMINTLLREIALAVAFNSTSPEDAGQQLVDEMTRAVNV